MIEYTYQFFGGKALKQFFKRYSYRMVKLFITQCVLGLFGSVLALAGAKSESNALTITISIFAVLFYLFLYYESAWKIGVEDKPAIDGGRLKGSALTGLYIGLGANIPTFLLALIHAVLYPIATTQEGFFSNVCGVSRILLLFFNGMYVGLMSVIEIGGVIINTHWATYFVITLPAILVCVLAYFAGTKEFHMTKLLLPVTPEEAEVKREKKNSKKQ